MIPNKQSLHCVKCAKACLIKHGQKAYRCESCGFVYFHNVAAAVCAVIVYEEQILLVERAEQPSKGKLDFPGGFVDYDESNEQALKRECMEELQLPVGKMLYLFSYPNRYLYKDVLYSTLDSFFEIKLAYKPDIVLQQQEVSRYFWLDIPKVDAEQIAFSSGQRALKAYLQRLKINS